MVAQDIGMCRSLAYQIAQHADQSDGLLFGITEQEEQTVQVGWVLARWHECDRSNVITRFNQLLAEGYIQLPEIRARGAQLSVDENAQPLGAPFVVTAAVLIEGHADAVVVVAYVVESEVPAPHS